MLSISDNTDEPYLFYVAKIDTMQNKMIDYRLWSVDQGLNIFKGLRENLSDKENEYLRSFVDRIIKFEKPEIEN